MLVIKNLLLFNLYFRLCFWYLYNFKQFATVLRCKNYTDYDYPVTSTIPLKIPVTLSDNPAKRQAFF